LQQKYQTITIMANVKDMMIRKPSLKYRDVRNYEGEYYDWAAGEHLLKKGTSVHELFHPLEHDIRFIKDEQVLLRDGVKILTDVYLPADTNEPLPAIIAWSPYGKNSGNADRFKALFGMLGLDQKRMSGLQKFEGPDPDFWCAQGYAIVHPDPRGIGRSEGDSTMLGTQEGEDGADLVEWVAQQPWCNGKVALSGTSYLSFSQWFIAAERPEHLVCTQVTEALTDGYRDMCLVGGMRLRRAASIPLPTIRCGRTRLPACGTSRFPSSWWPATRMCSTPTVPSAPGGNLARKKNGFASTTIWSGRTTTSRSMWRNACASSTII